MNQQSQRGLTTISLILIIALGGMILLTFFRVLPMYLDYFQIKSVMESVAGDAAIDPRSKKEIWEALNKRLYVNSIRYMKKENFSFTRNDDVTTINVDYEVRKPYVAELFIGANFVYSVEMKQK